MARTPDPHVPAVPAPNSGRAEDGPVPAPMRPVPYRAAPDLAATLAAWEGWLAGGRSASRHTLDAYRRDLAGFLRFFAEDLNRPVEWEDVSAAGTEVFDRYLAALAAQGRAPASIARAVSTLRNFYRFLGDAPGGCNPAIAALTAPPAPPSPSPPPARAIPPEATDRMVSGVALLSDEPWLARRDVALFALLCGAGLRLGEALALTVGEATALTVGEAPAGRTLGVGTGARRRTVPVPVYAADAVRDYLALRPGPRQPERPLFIGVRNGRPLNPGVVQRQMRRMRGLMGIPDRPTPETFRRCFLARLHAEGADLATLQRLLGHSALATTRRSAARMLAD